MFNLSTVYIFPVIYFVRSSFATNKMKTISRIRILVNCKTDQIDSEGDLKKEEKFV